MSGRAGQLVVVTGASRGIGARVAQAFRERGARVVRVARSLQPGERDGFIDVRCDLASAGASGPLEDMLASGTPDIVISNAGAFTLAPLEATSLAAFDEQVATNLRASFLVARTFLPAMRRAGHGTFVQVGSIADHVGLPGNSAYAASKYGVRGMHESLVAEYRGSGVRVSLVSPGATDTAAWDPVNPDANASLPSRRDMLRADDVAEAIVWVATRPAHVHVDWLRLGPA